MIRQAGSSWAALKTTRKRVRFSKFVLRPDLLKTYSKCPLPFFKREEKPR